MPAPSRNCASVQADMPVWIAAEGETGRCISPRAGQESHHADTARCGFIHIHRKTTRPQIVREDAAIRASPPRLVRDLG